MPLSSTATQENILSICFSESTPLLSTAKLEDIFSTAPPLDRKLKNIPFVRMFSKKSTLLLSTAELQNVLVKLKNNLFVEAFFKKRTTPFDSRPK